MLIYLWLALLVGFYASNVPVRAAFSISLGEQNALRLGVGVFSAGWIWEKNLEGAALFSPGWAKRARMPLNSGSVRFFLRAARYLMRHAVVRDARLSLLLGTGGAASTALICGAVNAVLSVLAARRVPVRARVAPRFEGRALKLSAGGMLSVRAGHIILAAVLGAAQDIARRVKNGKASH